MPEPIRRIGVLTGGGDAPGLNAVIRAVVKTAIHEYRWEVLGIENGFEGLIQPGMVRSLSYSDVRGILPRGGTILGTTNRASPFSYPVEMESGVEIVDVSEKAVSNARELGIQALIVIGGDGSLHIAYHLMNKGLDLVAVPKTIDNDLHKTQVTFGFDTALNTAMEALDKLHTTAESHHRVMILEVMGRDAGWIALQAGIAGGADVILIPEIPYRLDVIAHKIEERYQRGAKFSIITVAEGARPVGGEPVFQEKAGDGSLRRLGGIGQLIAEQIEQSVKMEVRVTVLGHLQRGGSPTAFDRLLASRFGAMAVHLIAEGKLGHMVSLQGERIVAVPIAAVVQGQKFVPLDSDILLTAFGLNVSLGNTRQAIEAMHRQISTRERQRS